MPLFSSSSSSSSSAPPAAPSRAERQQCWTHRDAYYNCLTAHNVTIPPGTDTSDGRGPPPSSRDVERARGEDPCKKERQGFEKNCARSWVDYFNKRRVLEERQRLMYAQQSPAPTKSSSR